MKKCVEYRYQLQTQLKYQLFELQFLIISYNANTNIYMVLMYRKKH